MGQDRENKNFAIIPIRDDLEIREDLSDNDDNPE